MRRGAKAGAIARGGVHDRIWLVPWRAPGEVSWSPARQGLAALAVVLAALTGAATLWLSGPGSPTGLVWAYVSVAALALFVPAAIALQVIGGQTLVGSLMLGQSVGALFLALLIASVIHTAELLAVVARLDSPAARHPRDDLRRVGLATAIGTAAFTIVLLLRGFPGPTGPVAILVACAACGMLAALLASRIFDRL